MFTTTAISSGRTPRQLVAHPIAAPAFTMIEVMICVVIIAIASAIVVPMVGGRADLKLAAATRKEVADLQYAQNLAIALRDTVYIRFDANQYTIFRRVGSTSTTIVHPVDQMDFVVKFGTTATDSSLREIAQAKPDFGSGLNVVGFDSLGAPLLFNESTSAKTSVTSSAAVTLTCSGSSQSIFVEPYTGEISAP